MTDAARSFLFSLLRENSTAASFAWLEEKLSGLRNNFTEKDFYLTFGLLPRYFGKEKIKFAEEQLMAAEKVRRGFNPTGFSPVQASRVLLALFIPADDESRYLKILNNLFSTGEVNELVALYSALPLLPHPELLRARASEGVRSNMSVVYDAVALNNPYPSEFLDEDSFNQMVLKAVFIERPLDKIYGLDQRANPELARMLSDYAHERWAASRYVTPELWRPVGPFLNENLLKDMERLLEQGSELDKQAAVLALQSSRMDKAKELLSLHLKTGAGKKKFDWNTISQKWFADKIR